MTSTATAPPLTCAGVGVHRAPRATSRSRARVRLALRVLAFTGFVAVQLAGLGFAAATYAGGLHLMRVLSGSMVPTYRPGDAVVTRPEPVRRLRAGQIAVFVPPGEAAPYAHRVTGVTHAGGAVTITTRGDANPAADPWHATLQGSRVQVVVAVVPRLGYLLDAGRRVGASAALIGMAGLTATFVLTRAVLRRARATS